jgi:pimeloyl-ACP methyl ester carboxylesterase
MTNIDIPEGTDPIPGHMVRTRTLDVHLREVGEGEPVLLVHGFPCTSHMWRHQMRALAAEGYRCLAMDTRGFGRSGKPGARVTLDLLARDVIDLMDALEVPTARIAGHDWGGVIVGATALRYPERFSHVTILDSPVSMLPNYAVHAYWFKAMPRPESFFARYAREFVGTVLGGRPRTYGGPPETPWPPAGQGTLSLTERPERPERPSFLTEQDIDHYVESFAQKGSWQHAISYYRDAMAFHRGTPCAEERTGVRYEYVDLRTVTEMWEHPGGLSAHPDVTWDPVTDPVYRHAAVDVPALLIYSRALMPGAFAGVPAGQLPPDGPVPNHPVAEVLAEQFSNLIARPVAGGHFMPEEEADRTNSLLLEHFGSRGSR